MEVRHLLLVRLRLIIMHKNLSVEIESFSIINFFFNLIYVEAKKLKFIFSRFFSTAFWFLVAWAIIFVFGLIIVLRLVITHAYG